MATKRERLVFIDVLRLLAAAQMIQGHAVSAVLSPAYQHGAAYEAWSFARGLTSVMFLFTAGYSLALAQPGGGAARRVRRAWTLVALGYLMHAPLGVLLGAPWEASLRAAVVVDVLPCIGVSLLALERFGRAQLGELRGVALLLVLACCLFELAPLTHAVPVEGLLRPLANYFTSRGGSLFPLVPWSGFVAAGFALGVLARRAPGAIPSQLSAAALGAGLCATLPPWLWDQGLPAGLSPRLSFIKLSCVLMLAAGLARTMRGRELPGRWARLSRETLFLYLSHVVILYADQVGLQSSLRDRHSPWFGLGLALVLMAACSAGALAWRRLRAGGTTARPER